MLFFSAIMKGDSVSVYADLGRKCRRGFVKTFTEPKMFVGNGISIYSRQQLFESNCKLR